MNVICDNMKCGFYQDGFCSNPCLFIRNGMCAYICDKRGRIINNDWAQPVEDRFKEKIIILDGAETEVNSDQ